MTEKQLFYPLLSVYFSLILGDLQKEKLQIVSIFRFGHKKRGLFQCPLKKGLNYNKQVGICLPIVISQKRCLLKLGITNFYKDILIPNSGYKNLLCLKFDKAGSYTLIKEV